jgi:hypothetical protein
MPARPLSLSVRKNEQAWSLMIAILVPEIRILAASPLETLSSSWEVRTLIVSVHPLDHSSYPPDLEAPFPPLAATLIHETW